MLYTKLTYLTGDEINATDLNHVETIAESALLDANSHLHDDVYMGWEDADELYWNEDNAEYCNADTLSGSHGLELLGTGAGLPIGAMCFWDGSLATIPAGYQLANGTNGTLDMRNYFPICTSAALTIGATVGANSNTPSGTITVGTTVLTISQIPSHRHGWASTYLHYPGTTQHAVYGTGSLSAHTAPEATASITTYNAGENYAHGHSGSTWSGSSISNMPPYKGIYIIERVS